MKLFLIGDAASCAKAHQKVPHGYYDLEVMLHGAAKHFAEIGICGTCLDARAMTDTELADSSRRSTLEELANWTAWADKTLVFQWAYCRSNSRRRSRVGRSRSTLGRGGPVKRGVPGAR